jgi:soluble lytic murein transglycosylase-like protein
MPLSLASAKPELVYEIKHKIPGISPATETARVASAEPPVVTPPIETAKDPVVAPEALNVVSKPLTKTLRSGPREIGRPFKLSRRAISQFRIKPNETNDTAFVLDIIRELAPSYGVPTWFALRIASVESGFDPYTRGLAGEIGVYQLKCETARAMGFAGQCYELTDARTNVRWGLRHLSLAIGSSGGDLHLAASKHNGGLGRTSLVNTYVAKVF